MTLEPDIREQVSVARKRLLLVAVWIPLVIVLIAIALQIVWLPELPDPAATHFSGNGPDGFGPGWTYPMMMAIVGLLMIVVAVGAAIAMNRTGSWGPAMRFLGALLPATIIMLSIGLTWSVASQRDLVDAADAPDAGGFILIGTAVGIGYGVIAWFVQPSLTVTTDQNLRATAVREIAASERLVWIRTARFGTPLLVITILAPVAIVIAAIFVTLERGLVEGMWMWLVAALVVLAMASMFVFKIRIDESGLFVRSALGIPRFRVALDDVAEAGVVTINPLGDFGGWGVRVMPGSGVGIVVRAGEALQIVRTNGKKLTVTVDDADRAAEVLLSLRDRRKI